MLVQCAQCKKSIEFSKIVRLKVRLEFPDRSYYIKTRNLCVPCARNLQEEEKKKP